MFHPKTFRACCQALLATATLLGLLFTAGCDSNSPAEEPLAEARHDAPLAVAFFAVDEAGQPIDPATVDDGTPVYEIRQNNPVLTPEGEAVTWGLFSSVYGSASVRCHAGGTTISVDLRGLIPGGLYTIWNVTFSAGGELIGVGVVGPPDGSGNVFRASADGTGRLSATTAGGDLSMIGSIGGCALLDEAEWHLVGSYHLDDQSHGPDLGPDGTAIEQFAFLFKAGRPQ